MPLKKPAAKRKKSKYNVAPKAQRTYKGVVYDSKLEKTYRTKLELLKKATKAENRVVDIQEQVDYPIFINGKKVFSYLLDFKVTYADGRIELIDVKGVRTDIFVLKKKCVEAYYGVKIKEVKRGEF